MTINACGWIRYCKGQLQKGFQCTPYSTKNPRVYCIYENWPVMLDRSKFYTWILYTSWHSIILGFLFSSLYYQLEWIISDFWASTSVWANSLICVVRFIIKKSVCLEFGRCLREVVRSTYRIMPRHHFHVKRRHNYLLLGCALKAAELR